MVVPRERGYVDDAVDWGVQHMHVPTVRLVHSATPLVVSTTVGPMLTTSCVALSPLLGE